MKLTSPAIVMMVAPSVIAAKELPFRGETFFHCDACEASCLEGGSRCYADKENRDSNDRRQSCGQLHLQFGLDQSLERSGVFR
jgi:hypothetical protein